MNRCKIFDQTVVAALIGLAYSLALCPSVSAQPVCNGTVSQFLLQATPAEERNFTGLQNGSLPLNWSCTWNIRAPKGYVIKLTFTKYSPYKATVITCRHGSSVEIKDGEDGGIVKNSCQGKFVNTFPMDKPFYSVNNYLSVSYSSGADIYAAINVQYKAVKPASECLPSQSLDSNQNIFVNGSHGSLVLPAAKIDCIWRITVPSNQIIKVVFPQTTCSKALYIEVFDGIYGVSDPLMQSNCFLGWPFEVAYSTGRFLSVRVWTLSSTSLPMGGFSANFTAIKQERSGSCELEGANSSLITVNGEEGSIFVPKYDTLIYLYWGPNRDCTWTVEVPSNKFIRLEFQRLSNMNEGYLEVRDGRYGNSVQLFKFCDLSFSERYPVLPAPVYSSGQFLQIRLNYKASGAHSMAWNGILILYKAVSEVPPPTPGICSQNNTPAMNSDIRLSDSSGSFRTPYYPKKYPRAISCTWKITAPLGKRVRLTFRGDSSVGYRSKDCQFWDYDYLEFRDGFSANSKEIRKKFCGNDLPTAVVSSGRDMLVRFVSNCKGSSSDVGFEAHYEVELTGGTIALIVVVVLAIVAIVAVALYCVWRKHRAGSADPSTVAYAKAPTA